MAEKASLFSITCDTCTARLTVRDESAIGQVLACPKCGSMVLVEAPDGWVATDGEPVPPRPRAPRDANDSQATLSSEFSGLSSISQSVARAPRRKSISAGASSITPAAARPVLPDASWESAAARRRSRTLGFIVALSLLCLVAVVAVIWLLSAMTGGGDLQLAGQPADARVNEGGDDAKKQTPPGDGRESPVKDSDSGPPGDSKTGDPATGDGSEMKQPHPENAVPDASDPDTTSPSDIEPSVNDAPPSDAGEDDPLAEVDPAGDGASDVDESLSIDGDATRTTLMDEIGALEQLLSDPGVDLDPGGSRAPLMGLGKVFIPRPRPLEIDLDRQLNETFPGISYQDKRLVEFLGSLNALTRIPIQLDSHSVIHGKLDPGAIVSFKGTDQSVLEMIEAVGKDLNLAASVVPESPVIVIRDKDRDIVATREFELNPSLAGDAEQTAELIGVIQRVTGPNLWNAFGGTARMTIADGKVTLESDGRLADEVRLALEKLGAAARVVADPADETALESLRSLRALNSELLDTPSTFDVDQREPIQQVLNELARKDALTVLVDWQSVMPLGWNPSIEMPWPGRDQTVGEALGDVAGSMGLGCRYLGDGIVELTTREVQWTDSRIAVYPCQGVLKKRTIEQVLGVLQAQLAGDLPEDNWSRVDFVPRFNCLLARLPDPLHLRVELILEELAR